MHVQVTITISGEKNESAESLLGRVAALIQNQPSVTVLHKSVTADEVSATVKKAKEALKEGGEKKQRGRPKLKKEEVIDVPDDSEDEEVDEEIEDDEDEEGDDEEADDEDGEEEEEEDEKPAKAKAKAKDKKSKGPTLDGDIIPAFKKFATAHGNPASAAMLKKFGVLSVRDLEPKDYPKILEAMSSYKPEKKSKK